MVDLFNILMIWKKLFTVINDKSVNISLTIKIDKKVDC